MGLGFLQSGFLIAACFGPVLSTVEIASFECAIRDQRLSFLTKACGSLGPLLVLGR